MAEHPLERGVTAATTMELDPEIRSAVREPVHRLYAQGLRPLLASAIAVGELRPTLDVDALISMLVLLLPHLALAPFEPGLDAGLALYGTTRRASARAGARRLLATRPRAGAGERRGPTETTTSSSSARASAAASARCAWSRRATRSPCSRPVAASPTTSSPRRRGRCATTCSRRALGCYGIFRLTPLQDVLVLTGAGVGGGSLGYANTLYQPRDEVFADVARERRRTRAVLRPGPPDARRHHLSRACRPPTG